MRTAAGAIILCALLTKPGAPAGFGLQCALAFEVQGVSRRTGPLSAATRDRLAFIVRALDGGRGSAEEIDGRSVRSEYEAIIVDPVLRERPDVTPTLRRVEVLRRIETGQDAAALVGAAMEAPADRPEQTLAAWRRLTQRTSAGGLPLWPLSGAELRQELALRAPLLRAIAAIPDTARQAALREEVAHEQSRRHRRVLLLPREDRDIEIAVELMDEFGLDAATLDERLRYNVELSRFKARTLVEATAPDGDLQPRRLRLSGPMLAEEAMRFRAAVRQLPGGVQFLGDVRTLLEGLAAFEEAFAKPQQAPPAKPDAGTGQVEGSLRWTNGPGTLPGAVVSYHGKDRSLVRFTFGAQEARGPLVLEFVALTQSAESEPGQTISYIGTREVSVATVAQAVDRFGSWPAFVDHLPVFGAREDPRPGVRTWDWTAAADGTAPVLSPATDFLGDEAVALNRSRSAEGVMLGAPATDHPMNWVPVSAVQFVAGLLGCRLPTVDEWLETERRCGSPEAGESMNLRDQSMAAQAEYLEGLRAGGIRAEQPDAGAFEPLGGWGVEPSAVHPWNDRAAYLRRTDHDSGLGCGVHDQIGNVAELVTMPMSAAEGAQPAATEFRVIGGSAFSPAGCDVRVPRVPRSDEVSEGWSDVGFRLAFTAAWEFVGKTTVEESRASAGDAGVADPDLIEAAALIAGARYLRSR